MIDYQICLMVVTEQENKEIDLQTVCSADEAPSICSLHETTAALKQHQSHAPYTDICMQYQTLHSPDLDTHTHVQTFSSFS